MFQRNIKVPAMNNQLSTESLHRGIFIGAVPFRHDHNRWYAASACRESDTLAMVATRGRTNA